MPDACAPVTPTHLGAGQGVAGVPTATRPPHHQHQQELPQRVHGGAGASGCPGPTLATPQQPLPWLHGPRRRRRLLLPALIPDTRALRGVSNRPGVGPRVPAPATEGSVLRHSWGGIGAPHRRIGSAARARCQAGSRQPRRLWDMVWWCPCRYRLCPAGCVVCPCCRGALGSRQPSRAPTNPPATPERQQGRVKLQLYCFHPRPSPAGNVEAKSRARLCPAPAPLATCAWAGQGASPSLSSFLHHPNQPLAWLWCSMGSPLEQVPVWD